MHTPNRTSTLPALMIALCLTAQPQVKRLISPEVHPDRTITFRLKLPAAQKVTLRGDWASYVSIPMTRGDDAVWSVTVGPLAADLYSYHYSADGVNFIDPLNHAAKTGLQAYQGVLRKHSLVEVLGAESKFHQFLNVPHGTVHVEWCPSKVAGRTLRIHVYTPPSYDPGATRRYPALYLLHGAGDHDASWIDIGRTNWIVDNLLAANTIRPFVVVMPEGLGAFLGDAHLFEDAGALDRYLLEDILPFVESRYKLDRRPSARAIAGASSGGNLAFDVGFRHLDTFSYIGVMSMSLDPPARYHTTFQERYSAALADADLINSRLKLLWIACGEQDGLCEPSKRPTSLPPIVGYDLLRQAGIKYSLVMTPGGHDWLNWRRYLRDFATQVFQ